jgi:hypothetical protein
MRDIIDAVYPDGITEAAAAQVLRVRVWPTPVFVVLVYQF